MIVTISFFARARDVAGVPSASFDLPDGATVGDLRSRLCDWYPALAGLLQRSAIAVNDEFAGDGTVLKANAAIAMLPPVSGG